ncbi:hypothetical protein QPK87_18240 [Kamptonema cortianum]|nr:hypothetical protein [Geitlerinema splendidum]MDK3158497.1 hypothetical protein [Kamptonema cortianum]
MAEYLKYMENMPRPKMVTTSPAKILLVAAAKGDFGNTTFSVIVYDQKGDVILREQMGFHVYVPCAYDSKATSPSLEGTDQNEEDGHSNQGDERLQAKLVVDEKVKRIISSIEAGFETGQIDPTVQDEAIQIGTRPDLYEPISLITGEGIAQISSTLGKNIVACVPDRFGDWFYGVPESLQELYSDLQEESFAEDAKWIVVAPKDAIYSRQVRLERNSLATLLTTVSNTGHVSLDELANFVASNDRRAMESSLFSSLARAFAPSIFGGMLFGMETQPTFLRLFGLLSAGQRAALRAGRPVAFGTLSPAAREELNYVLFGIQNSLEVFSPEKPLKRPSLDEMLGQGMMFLEGQMAGGDYRTEPTEIMPTGLPAQGFLQADVSMSSYAMPLGRNGKANFASMSMSSLELAFLRAMMDVPEVMAEASQFIEIFNNMVVGQRTNLYIGANVATGVAQTSELNDNGKPGTQRYSIRKLPEPLETEVAAMVKEVKASQMFQFFGGMGSSPPIKP